MIKPGHENFTFKGEDGNLITVENIPSAEVDALRKSLNLSTRKEALELWCFDHDKMPNAEAEALTAKARANGAGIRNTAGKKRKAPTRKPDETKRALIKHLAEALADTSADTIIVENVERLITFSIGDDTYKLTLSKNRKSAN